MTCTSLLEREILVSLAWHSVKIEKPGILDISFVTAVTCLKMQYGTATKELKGHNPSMPVLPATKLLIQVIQQLYTNLTDQQETTAGWYY